MSAQKKALVVDDQEPIRDLLETLLAHRGFQSVHADSVEGGLHHLEESGPFDVAFVDFNLTDGTGDAVISAAKERLPGISIICMSGREDNRPVAEKAGARFMRKPFRVEDIYRCLPV